MQENPWNSAERATFSKFQAPKFENSEPEKSAIPYPHPYPQVDDLLFMSWTLGSQHNVTNIGRAHSAALAVWNCSSILYLNSVLTKFGIVQKVFSEKASAIARMRQKRVRNASKMRQKCVKVGLVLLGKEERSKMRQNCVKNARNTLGGEHLLDDTEKWGFLWIHGFWWRAVLILRKRFLNTFKVQISSLKVRISSFKVRILAFKVQT